MNRIYLKFLCLLILLGFVASCASYTRPDLNQLDIQPIQKSGMQKVDNFFIIMDRSQSMDRVFDGERKLDVARTTIARMSETLPEMEIMSGFRTFGYHYFGDGTDLINGLSSHSNSDLKNNLIMINDGASKNYLDEALYAAATDLESSKGKIALFIVSDGMNMAAGSKKALSHLTKAFGDRICIYPISIGNNEAGKAYMDELANIGSCGFAVTADDIASPEAMTRYVYKVFFIDYQDSDGDGVIDPMDECPDTPAGIEVDKNGCEKDSDRDGVVDSKDKCPNTPAGIEVDRNGCEKDSDLDGVVDSMDKCPNTPKGAMVNNYGCWVLADVTFDTSKATIKDSFMEELNNVVKVLKKNPDIQIMVQGFTDNVGNIGYNLKLSQSRAQAVMEYLVSNGVDSSRLTAKGFGINNPITTNSTAEGRAKNRRVELKPVQ
ncbi:MAG: OmpA family protein [Desulfobacterales bacterium]|nr:OmpA family protein [Desulfobacterales bacterium]